MLKYAKSLTAMALAMATLAGAAQADYPEKPVEFIVPWPPGDLEDVLTRMIAENFQAEYGVAAVNKPGGDAPFDDMAGLAAHAADNNVVLGNPLPRSKYRPQPTLMVGRFRCPTIFISQIPKTGLPPCRAQRRCKCCLKGTAAAEISVLHGGF